MIEMYKKCLSGKTNVEEELISIMEKYYRTYWLEEFPYECECGHINIILFLIKKGANNWNEGLNGACKGGHIDIVNLMIEKGADNWNDGLRGACYGGHMDLVNFMIEKGSEGDGFINWNDGLQNACAGGHIDIVNFMIEKGANYWDRGFSEACEKGHINIVNLIIEKVYEELKESEKLEESEKLGFSDFLDLTNALLFACQGGHADILKIITAKAGAEGLDWNRGLEAACYTDKINTSLLMLEKGADPAYLYGLCKAYYYSKVTDAIKLLNISDCGTIVYEFIYLLDSITISYE